MVQAQKQEYGSMEKDRKPRGKRIHLLVYDRGGNGEKTVSSISAVGKIGKLCVKK